MHRSWSKGFTKETHPSVKKISVTMRRKKIDNFKEWRERMKRAGKIKKTYPAFKRDGDLAELIGVVLGDGHIGVFPRCESLRIVSNAKNTGFIHRYTALVAKLFQKEPHVSKRTKKNAVNITIYERYISKRLGIPSGSRKHITAPVPGWILKNKSLVIRYLRGLYEAEGSYSTHKPTHTYKVFFSNLNQSLLQNVYQLLGSLGFHPHRDSKRVQLSRKTEVEKFIQTVQFRVY